MEGLHTIQQLIRRDHLITKVDLSDFYMHFLIGHADRRYMRFMWEGKKYQHHHALRSRPGPEANYQDDGISDQLSRLCGLRIAIYIDDLILLCRSYKESIAHIQLLVNTLHNLGFGIHPEGTSDPLLIVRVFGHTGEQQEDAVPSASRQNPIDPKMSATLS